LPKSEAFLISLGEKCRADVNRFVYYPGQSDGNDRSAQLQAALDFVILNLTHCGDTKSSMRRDVSWLRTSI
jgi:hypothetical protein